MKLFFLSFSITSGLSKQMKWSKCQTVPQVNQQSIIVVLMTTKSELKLEMEKEMTAFFSFNSCKRHLTFKTSGVEVSSSEKSLFHGVKNNVLVEAMLAGWSVSPPLWSRRKYFNNYQID